MKKIMIGFLLIYNTNIFAAQFNSSMQEYINGLKIEAKQENSSFVDFSVKEGEKIFSTSHMGKKGEMVSCTSCHNIDLTTMGKNVFTNKLIEPLSPNKNSQRLTNVKDVEKWLKRNFKDVYNREGTAQEKGDVLYYINTK